MFPNTPLPPQPIVTRWGSWIEAAIYFAIHFDKIKEFLAALDPEDAKCIRKAQATVKLPNLKQEIAFIKYHFAVIPLTISKLEAKGVPLTDAIETFESVRVNLLALKKRPEFLQKFDYVVARNKGLARMKIIAQILQTGGSTVSDEFIEKLTPAEIEA